MSDKSAIEWTDATWNPVRGCEKVSPGCAHCYAETFAERFRGVPGHPYEQGFDLRLVPEKLTEPLSWKKPRRVFVNSMSDLFQDGVPDDFIDRVFAIMALTPQHTYQVLTKRPERMHAYMNAPDVRQRVALAAAKIDGDPAPEMVVRFWPLLNVWLGVSVENQHFADERIPLLLQTPAAVRFISAEPLLGPVDLSAYLPVLTIGGVEMERWLDWVIVGGESGPKSRPFDVAWARSIIAQCKAAGVPVFVKQLGARVQIASSPLAEWHGSVRLLAGPNGGMGRVIGLQDKKGGDPAEWPTDLRIREFPEARGC